MGAPQLQFFLHSETVAGAGAFRGLRPRWPGFTQTKAGPTSRRVKQHYSASNYAVLHYTRLL